eukprot:365122-Chlamydomonas_euryale.AAC.4
MLSAAGPPACAATCTACMTAAGRRDCSRSCTCGLCASSNGNRFDNNRCSSSGGDVCSMHANVTPRTLAASR